MSNTGKFYISIYNNGIYIRFTHFLNVSLSYEKYITFPRSYKEEIIHEVKSMLPSIPSYCYDIGIWDLNTKSSSHSRDFHPNLYPAK